MKAHEFVSAEDIAKGHFHFENLTAELHQLMGMEVGKLGDNIQRVADGKKKMWALRGAAIKSLADLPRDNEIRYVANSRITSEELALPNMSVAWDGSRKPVDIVALGQNHVIGPGAVSTVLARDVLYQTGMRLLATKQREKRDLGDPYFFLDHVWDTFPGKGKSGLVAPLLSSAFGDLHRGIATAATNMSEQVLGSSMHLIMRNEDIDVEGGLMNQFAHHCVGRVASLSISGLQKLRIDSPKIEFATLDYRSSIVKGTHPSMYRYREFDRSVDLRSGVNVGAGLQFVIPPEVYRAKLNNPYFDLGTGCPIGNPWGSSNVWEELWKHYEPVIKAGMSAELTDKTLQTLKFQEVNGNRVQLGGIL